MAILDSAGQKAAGRIPSLDGLRAVSILVVMFSHASRFAPGSLHDKLDEVTLRGHLGVDIFFVISGYLITRLLREELEREGSIGLGRFYLRRTLRILPPFWLLLAAVGTLQLLGRIDLAPHEWLEALLFVYNYRLPPQHDFWLGHTWSLSVEEQFYLLWPWVIALLGILRARRVAAALILLAPVVRVGLGALVPGVGPRLDWMLPARMDTLMWGCLVALLEGESRFERLRQQLFDLGVHRLALLVVFPFTGIFTLLLRGRYLYSVGYTLEALCIVLVLLHATRAPRELPGTLLEHPVARFIGQRSYSLYLWQQVFLVADNTTWSGRFPFNVALAFVCAELSYRLVEQPLGRVRRRLEERPAPQPAATA